MAEPRLTKAEQYEKTRIALLDVAHELFCHARVYRHIHERNCGTRRGDQTGRSIIIFGIRRIYSGPFLRRFRQSRTQALLGRIQESDGGRLGSGLSGPASP